MSATPPEGKIPSASTPATPPEPTAEIGPPDHTASLGAISGAVEATLATTEAAGRYTPPRQGPGEIGRGGLGVVRVAFDEDLQREVAVKELLLDRAASDADTPVQQISLQAARFLREARVTAQLEHPSIVPVYEVGRRRDGRLYYTMKLVRGRTLAEVLRERRTLPERLRMLQHFIDMCQAVAYAHSRRVIHRDLKPHNVMVGEFGETVLLDWGLAKVKGRPDADDADATPRAAVQPGRATDGVETVVGTVLGTPAYMSPEQATGDVEAVDERSDVWSLGAVLYQILTGEPPFTGRDHTEILARVRSEVPVPVAERVPEAPRELAAICAKALARDPAARYQTAGALAQDLESFEAGRQVGAYAYRSAELLKRFVARNRAAVVVGSIAAVVLAIGAAEAYRRVVAERRTVEKALAMAEYNEAVRLVEQGQPAEALAHLSQSVRSDSSLAGARSLLLDLALRVPLAQPLATIPHEGRPTVARYSRDGRRFVAADEHSLRVFDAATGARVGPEIRPPSDSIAGADLSPDGSRVAVGTDEGTLQVWDVLEGRPLTESMKHWEVLVDAQTSPDGRVVAVRSDRSLRFWDTSTGRAIGERGDTHQGDIVFTDDDRLALVPRYAGFRVVDVRSGNERNLQDMNLGVSDRKTPSLKATRDGGRVLALYESGVQLWDAVSGKILRSSPAKAASFAADGSHAFVLVGKSLETWETASGRTAADPVPLGVVSDILVASDGSAAVVRSLGEARLWSLMTRSPAGPSFSIPLPFGLWLSSDGKRLLTNSLSDRRTLRLWDTETGRELGRGITVEADPLVSPGGASYAIAAGTRVTLLAGTDGRSLATVDVASVANDIALDPSGTTLAVAADDGNVRLFNSEGGPLGSLAHDGPVYGLAWSGDGAALTTRTLDAARVWNVRTRQTVVGPLRDEAEVRAVRFSPDGHLVAAAGSRGVQAWDASTGRAPQPAVSGGYFSRLEFSADGRDVLLLSAEVVAWNPKAKTFRRFPSLDSDAGGNNAALSTDGRRVALGRDMLSVWDIASGRRLAVTMGGPCRRLHANEQGTGVLCVPRGGPENATATLFERGSERVSAASSHPEWWRRAPWSEGPPLDEFDEMALFPDGERALVVSGNRIRVWNLRDGRDEVAPIVTGSWIHGFEVAPGGKRFLARTATDVQAWRLEDWRSQAMPLTRVTGLSTSPVWSPDSSAVAAGDDKGLVHLWSAHDGSRIGAPRPLDGKVQLASFSPDGERLLAATEREGRLWRATTGEILATIPAAQEAVWSADGSRVLTWSWRTGVAQVFDGRNGQPVGAPLHGLFSAALSSDGRQVVTGGDRLRLWNVETGAAIAQGTVRSRVGDYISPVLMTPDGSHVVATGLEAVLVVQSDGSRIVRSMPGSFEAITPDARVVVLRRPDHSRLVWEPLTGRVMATIGGLDLQAFPELSDDGRRVAIKKGREVQLWDTHTGRLASAALVHHGDVNSMRFSDDGQRLLTKTADGVLRVWDVPTGVERHGEVLADLAAMRARPTSGTPSIDAGRSGNHRLAAWALDHSAARTMGPSSTVGREQWLRSHVIRRTGEGGPLGLRMREVPLPQVFAALNSLAPEVGYVIDDDVEKKLVTIELNAVTLGEALETLRLATGVRISADGSLRHVTRGREPRPGLAMEGTGHPVTLHVDDGVFLDLLRLMQDISGMAVHLPAAAMDERRLTIFVSEVPWDAAFLALLAAQGLTHTFDEEAIYIRRLDGAAEPLQPLPTGAPEDTAARDPQRKLTPEDHTLVGIAWSSDEPTGRMAWFAGPRLSSDIGGGPFVALAENEASLGMSARVVAIGGGHVEWEADGKRVRQSLLPLVP